MKPVVVTECTQCEKLNVTPTNTSPDLQRLDNTVGIKGSALQWFESYLSAVIGCFINKTEYRWGFVFYYFVTVTVVCGSFTATSAITSKINRILWSFNNVSSYSLLQLYFLHTHRYAAIVSLWACLLSSSSAFNSSFMKQLGSAVQVVTLCSLLNVSHSSVSCRELRLMQRRSCTSKYKQHSFRTEAWRPDPESDPVRNIQASNHHPLSHCEGICCLCMCAWEGCLCEKMSV